MTVEAEMAPAEWAYTEGGPWVASPEADRKRRGKDEKLSMYLYGATCLRVTEMAKAD